MRALKDRPGLLGQFPNLRETFFWTSGHVAAVIRLGVSPKYTHVFSVQVRHPMEYSRNTCTGSLQPADSSRNLLIQDTPDFIAPDREGVKPGRRSQPPPWPPIPTPPEAQAPAHTPEQEPTRIST